MLKVGDKVKIRKDLGYIYRTSGPATFTNGINPAMIAYAGKAATVEGVYFDQHIKLDIDKGLWYWDAEMLELIEPTQIKPETKPEPVNPVAAAQAELVNHCLNLLDSKKADYATADYFHTFHTAAELQEITPLQALGGMAAKHVASVFKLFNEHAEGRELSREMWIEKLGDVINYLLIAWAWLETVEASDGE